jgi:hypothetical protein
MNFIPLLGKFEITNGSIIFEGRTPTQPTTGADLGNIGNLLSDQFFGGGTLQGTIEFTDAKDSACGLMLFYNPLNTSFIEAQLGGIPFASLWSFVNPRWESYAQTGLGTQIVEGRKYKVRVTALGSSVSIWVDGVQV